MSREIKFRGKVYHNPQKVYLGSGCQDGEWVYGDLHLQSANPHIHIKEHHREPINVDTIGQFTGLHDKNEKPIYEGDIIKVVDCVKVVKYINEICSFCFGNIETLKEPVFAKWGDLYNYHQINGTYWEEYKNEIEVIGNIHDNPELMK